MRKIVVFGASGGVGKKLVEYGLEKGFEVRGIYRDPFAATTFEKHPHFEKRISEDIFETQFFSNALVGVDAVLSGLGMRRTQTRNPWSTILSPEDLNFRFAKQLCEKLRESSTPIIVVSGGGVGDSRKDLNPILRKVFYGSSIGIAYKDLARMENLFEENGANWLAVRPTTLTNGPLKKTVKLTNYFGLLSTISRSDVAWYMLEALEKGISEIPLRTPMITG